ncbi:uncharacterized protein [Dermacentor andersoni]|uniref:uncharacterized protein n=1 Tax=Dermacentor andersoni TaxID=34620 RepID=UPI002415D424|nr:uncharacterized protein LOC129384353 [Dermacentor andersoni]
MVLRLIIVLYTSEILQIAASGDQKHKTPTVQQEPDGESLIPRVPLQDVLPFLQTYQDIHLQMINLDDWNNLRCECVKSRFQARHNNGCERTLHCYTWVKVSMGERMVKEEGWVDFQAVEVDGFTSVDLKRIVGILPTEDAPEELPHSYVVAKVAQDCLLVTYGQSSDGQQKCLLWGLSGSHVSTDTECYKALKSICPDDMYDMTESDGPCLQYDRHEDSRNNKGQEDE